MSGAVASRYAAALADVAFEENIPERAKGDLRAFTEAYLSSADLRNVLESPAVDGDDKHKVVEVLAQRMNLAPAVRNFIYLIVDHRRMEMLREIEQAFQAELNTRLGVAEAEVASARALTDEEKRRLIAALEQRTGKKIVAHFREDRSLVGGAVVRVGSTIYDGSVREQLARLREQLVAE